MYQKCACLLSLLVLIGAAAPVGATAAPLPLPLMDAELDLALDGVYPEDVKPPGVELGSIAELRGQAERRALERLTPERLAATLAAMAGDGDVPLMDALEAGAILYNAATAPDTPFGAAAARVVDDAFALRIEGGASGQMNGHDPVGDALGSVPVDVPGAPGAPGAPDPEVPAAPDASDMPDPADLAKARTFSAPSLVGLDHRDLRHDVLTIERSHLFDSLRVEQALSQSTLQQSELDVYYYAFYSWFFTYDYYYRYDEQTTSSHAYYDEVITRLYTLHETFDRWEFTSALDIRLFAQTAGVADDIDAAALYTLLTPYTYVDHWWVISAVQEFQRQISHSESHEFAGYWSVVNDRFVHFGSERSSFSSGYTLESSFRTATEESGYNRIARPDVTLLRSAIIEFALPAGELKPLARGDGAFDFRTAITMVLPEQVGVEYKDERARDALFTTPAFSDLSLRLASAPFTDELLLRGDQAALELGDAASEITSAVEALRGDAEAILMDVLAAASDPTVPEPPGVPDLPGVPEPAAPPLPEPEVPDPEVPEAPGLPESVPAQDLLDAMEIDLSSSPAWLVASYTASRTDSWSEGGAGIGVLAPKDADVVKGRPIMMRVTALGLGAPSAFAIDVDGEDVVATPIQTPAVGTPETEVPGAPEAPPAPVGPDDLPGLEIPLALSLPAYLDDLSVLAGDVSMEDAGRAIVLATPPSRYAATMILMDQNSEESPVAAEDLLRLQLLAYLAGPGAEGKQQEQARALLAEAILLRHASASDGDACIGEPSTDVQVPDAGEPGVPDVPDAPAAPGAPGEPEVPGTPAEAECLAAEADEVAQALTAKGADSLDLLGIQSRTLRHNTHIASHSEYREFVFDRTTSVSGGYSTRFAYEAEVVYEYWTIYYERLMYGNSGGYLSTTEFHESFSRALEGNLRIDEVDGVTSMLFAQRAAHPAGLQGDLLTTVAVPFSIVTADWTTVVTDAYAYMLRTRDAGWWHYYQEHVYNGQGSSLDVGDSYDHSSESIYVVARETVDGGRIVVPLPGVVVSPGASITYLVPAKSYALMARDAPFGADLAGFVPTQLEPGRTQRQVADALAIAPAANTVALLVDEDPLAAGPTAEVARVHADAFDALAMAEDEALITAANPARLLGLLPAVPEVEVPEAPGAPDVPMPDADALIAIVTDEASARAAEVQAIADDPEGFVASLVAQATGAAADAEAAARDTTVDPGSADVPKRVEDSALYEVYFEAEAFVAGRPAATNVGLVYVPDAQPIDDEPVRIVLTGQGVQGRGALGGEDAFAMLFSTDLNGADLLPDTVAPGAVNVGDTADQAAAKADAAAAEATAAATDAADAVDAATGSTPLPAHPAGREPLATTLVTSRLEEVEA